MIQIFVTNHLCTEVPRDQDVRKRGERVVCVGYEIVVLNTRWLTPVIQFVVKYSNTRDPVTRCPMFYSQVFFQTFVDPISFSLSRERTS